MRHNCRQSRSNFVRSVKGEQKMTQVKYLRRFWNSLDIPGDEDDEEKSILAPLPVQCGKNRPQ